MEPKRIGRQTPTTSLVLPYKKTKGKEDRRQGGFISSQPD